MYQITSYLVCVLKHLAVFEGAFLQLWLITKVTVKISKKRNRGKSEFCVLAALNKNIKLLFN